jgi:hypothetical protein
VISATGALAEMFLATSGRDGIAGWLARDAAAVSRRAPAEAFTRDLTRNTDGSASGPLGAVLDLLAEAER